MRRAWRWLRNTGTLGFIVIVALLCLAYSIFTTNRPFLGLDLQGGVSVVLQPVKKNVSADTLQEAINIINLRINQFGVSEAQISRQGNNILVEIPGVKDKDRALKLVGETAELQFRPVLAVYSTTTPTSSTTTTSKGATTTTTKGTTTTTAHGATTTTAGSAATTTTTKASTTTQKALGAAPASEHAVLTSASVAAAGTTTTTKAATSTTAAGAKATTTTAATSKSTTTTAATATLPPLTPEALRTSPAYRDKEIVAPETDPKTGKEVARYVLGPTVVTGAGLSTASADIDQNGKWEVRPVFKGGKNGIDAFNTGAGACYSGAATCPTHQMAILLDGRVLTAPTINNASFQADQITISGGFDQSSAHDVATALKYGALPVQLKQATAEIVSATLGKDALHAGIVAGIVAFILVGIYMILFYRLLGVLALLKLGIEGCILWGFLCWAGPHLGLALTLAGITGIIVSIGVSLDSNVVYYEHLKEDVRAGRTVRAAVDKSFVSAWSTIIAADVSSILGAVLLYYLTVGAVRGFAFFLGLSTLLDLLTSYCYMRPAVARATRSKMCQEHPHRFGLPDADDVAEATGATRRLVGARA
jgi:preprotein translocase subunit SecD